MITIADDLRKAILQAAIQGKLTDQRPEDGNAEDLYNEIQAEKQKLIKEGKIKKEKALPPIEAKEIPFDIPMSWKWTRWGDLSFSIQYGFNAPAQNTGKIRMVRISDIQRNKVRWDYVPFCNIPDESIPDYKLQPNDILFARTGGTVGKSFLVKEVPFDSIYAGYLIRTRYSSRLVPQYMKFFMESQLYWDQLKEGTTATAQPNCNGKTLSRMLIPLPPISEQNRIVARLNELMAKIDEIENTEKHITDLYNAFPGDMKAALLQAAIQGKLTEQLPEDGNAEDLYNEIQAEKQKLIREGKIKKEKPLPLINPDDLPFDIPENWKWAQLGNITLKNIKRGKSPHYAKNSTTLVFAQKCNTKAGNINVELAQFLDDTYLKSYPSDEFMCDCDIVINSTGGGTLGRVGIFRSSDNPTGLRIVPDSHVTVIRTKQEMLQKYLYHVLKFMQPEIETLGSGSTNQTELSPDIIKSLYIPLPPLSEQMRIVGILEQLLPICDSLM